MKTRQESSYLRGFNDAKRGREYGARSTHFHQGRESALYLAGFNEARNNEATTQMSANEIIYWRQMLSTD